MSKLLSRYRSNRHTKYTYSISHSASSGKNKVVRTFWLTTYVRSELVSLSPSISTCSLATQIKQMKETKADQVVPDTRRKHCLAIREIEEKKNWITRIKNLNHESQ